MKFTSAVATVALSLALGGCLTGTGTVYHTDDPYAFLNYAAMKGSVPVVVASEPAAGTRSQVQQTAIEALRRQFPSQAAAFQPANAAPGEGTKIVFLFNSGRAQPVDVCRDPTRFAASSGANGATYSGVIYCGAGPYSEAWFSGDKPIAPGTPEFGTLIAQLVYEGVPRDPDPSKYDHNSPPPL